ncbi:hypothetical protein O181_112361 [Austropuccinia psidii MF-1]|uniref:Uncharacterized protein n=1 Tax=Austropuccinia psidii MF-1 TaxID=1389203 RepID=A0A9Q3PTH8_9BASI|nr:hypothetical protein [Austropuccinia psidii MF-1]
MAPRQLLKCYYWLEEGHSSIRFNHITEEFDKRIVLKCGGTYIFPNFQRVPTEGPTSANELDKQFAKEQEELTKKLIEKENSPPNKQGTTVIEERKGEKAEAIAQIEEWRNWKPPKISPANENIQIRFGIRKKRQRAERQESQNQTQQENKNETQKHFKNKIPRAYCEEDEAEEEIRFLIPTKYKKTKERKEVYNDDIKIIPKEKNKAVLRQDSQKMEVKNKVKSTSNAPKLITEHVMKKILSENINFNLE